MCEHSTKLVAWLDGELPADDASNLGQHLNNCRECAERVSVYRQISDDLKDYCGHVMPVESKSRPHWGVPAAAGALAAGLLIMLLIPRTPPTTIAVPPASATPAPEVAFEKAAPKMTRKVVRRHPAKPVQRHDALRQFSEPEFQITIPAEALFPPGAVPEGVRFVADVSIGADGTAQTLQLRPY